MTEAATRRRRGGGRAGAAERRGAAVIEQMPWRIPVNIDRPTEPLSEEGVAAIHDGAMRILEEIGIQFLNPEAIEILREAGCKIEGETVFMDRDFVMDANEAKAYGVIDEVINNRGDVVGTVHTFQGVERPVIAVEKLAKGFLFDCRMCGQCALSSTGMSCPMNCPKSLRNGPCGGVRADGNCEVEPDMPCVWVQAWEGAQRMRGGDAINAVQKPIDQSLVGASSWLKVTADAAAARAGEREPVGR